MAIGVYDPQYVVSIHAPWEGCDNNKLFFVIVSTAFQFTHPGKGATRFAKSSVLTAVFQFTHPGKGATLPALSVLLLLLSFNSRTLGRVRRGYHRSRDNHSLFQFTHPGKGATNPKCLDRVFSVFQFTHPGKGATR